MTATTHSYKNGMDNGRLVTSAWSWSSAVVHSFAACIGASGPPALDKTRSR